MPFTVRVVDSGNRPVAGASVSIVTAAEQAFSARTSGDGSATFSISRGAVKSVDVDAPGFLPGHSGAVVVSAEVVVTGGSTQARSRTDARGVATFSLPNGTYEMIATAPGSEKVAGAKVEVPRTRAPSWSPVRRRCRSRSERKSRRWC